MNLITFLAGALVPTLLFSRLALWVLKRWKAGAAKLIVANAASYAIMSTIAAFGMANGGPPKFGAALVLYAMPQIVWLVLDIVRYRRTGVVTVASWSPITALGMNISRAFLNFVSWYLGWVFLLQVIETMGLTLATDYIVTDVQSFVAVFTAWSGYAYILATLGLLLITAMICKMNAAQAAAGWGIGFVASLVVNLFVAPIDQFLPPYPLANSIVRAFMHWEHCIIYTLIAAALITGNFYRLRRRRAHATAVATPTVFD